MKGCNSCLKTRGDTVQMMKEECKNKEERQEWTGGGAFVKGNNYHTQKDEE